MNRTPVPEPVDAADGLVGAAEPDLQFGRGQAAVFEGDPGD